MVVIYAVMRLATGGLLAWAALEKARRPSRFVKAVEAYRVLPHFVVAPAAILVVAAEFVVGAAMLLNLAPIVAASFAAALFGLFAAAITLNLLRRNVVPCHCFGSANAEPIGLATLVRASVLLGLSVGVLVLAVVREPEWPPAAPAAISVAFISASAALVIRWLTLVPLAVGFLRASAVIPPSRLRRVSYKHQSLTASLRPSMTNGAVHPNVVVDLFRAKRVES
jgi:hypothetical protein